MLREKQAAVLFFSAIFATTFFCAYQPSGEFLPLFEVGLLQFFSMPFEGLLQSQQDLSRQRVCFWFCLCRLPVGQAKELLDHSHGVRELFRRARACGDVADAGSACLQRHEVVDGRKLLRGCRRCEEGVSAELLFASLLDEAEMRRHSAFQRKLAEDRLTKGVEGHHAQPPLAIEAARMQGHGASAFVVARFSVEEGVVETGDFLFFRTAFQRVHNARCHLGCCRARVGETEDALWGCSIEQ